MISLKLQQELRLKYNPDGSDLRKYQLRLLEILKFIDSICKKHKIKYWLSSGTCLGAVRHKGFIPWDDDVDIEMLPSDYTRFCNILKHMESSQFALQTYETDKEYVAPFGKVRDVNSLIKENNLNDLRYKYKGFYVDVFPVYYSSSRIIARITGIIQYNLLHRMALINNNRIRRFAIALNHFLVTNIIFSPLMLISRINCQNKIRIGGLGSAFLKRYDYKCIENLIDWEFEGCYFPIPKGYDEYLSNLYGNYMTLPDLENIHPHITSLKFSK